MFWRIHGADAKARRVLAAIDPTLGGMENSGPISTPPANGVRFGLALCAVAKTASLRLETRPNQDNP